MLASGLGELDLLLGGGVDRGTSTLLLGPAGSGKSTMVLQYIEHAANSGERAVIFAFDETKRTFIRRAKSLGYELDKHLQRGVVQVSQINPAEMTPGEFADAARTAVDQGVRIVVIDSLNGYLNAMPDERHLIIHLHDLLKYLSSRDVTTFLVASQAGILGTSLGAPVDTTYLADTVLLFRFFEADGALHQALSVVKRRGGLHERTIRELSIGPVHLSVGQPLVQFQGILSGTPILVDRVSHDG
jgi:circadian clock protein KaiC